MNIYLVGNTVRLQTTLTDIAGAAGDPTAIVFKIRDPAGTVTEYAWNADTELVRAAAGVFRVDWPVALAGRHTYRWEATGALVAAAEQSFTARAASFG